MIVELVGAPGAGKSHLAPMISAKYGVPVIKIGRLGQRNFYFALFALKNWRLTREFYAEFRRQEREHPELRSEVKFRRFRSMGAKIAKARLLGGGLIDEGLFQGVLKVFEEPASRKQMEHYVSLIGTPPDRIILIEATDAQRIDRMKLRRNVPRLYLGEDNWRHWHASFVENLALLKTILLERGDTEIIVNDRH